MTSQDLQLPGLDCGQCGYRTCVELSHAASTNPMQLKKCIHLKANHNPAMGRSGCPAESCPSIASPTPDRCESVSWRDSLDREFDFILDPFPEEPGPRETIHPLHWAGVQARGLHAGDLVTGRPLVAGCPVTHCGKIKGIDEGSALIDWWVVGPMAARGGKAVEIGAYLPVAFEGLVSQSRVEIRIGQRYQWLPRSCMMQWRHSGIVNFIVRDSAANLLRVRIEGVTLG
jgi:uncharacterized Fe-S cluster-containing protein